MTIRFYFLIAIMLASALAALGAQPTRSGAPSSAALRVFLDCNRGCDFDHFRVETPWVAFVRDRAVADLHLLVTNQETGGGGDEYTINALGLGAYALRNDTLVFHIEPSATDDTRRAEVLRHIQLALVPYASRTVPGRALRVLAGAADDGGGRPTGPDRWNAWVFSIGADGEVQREQQQSDFNASGELSAQRITQQLKLGIEFDGDFRRSRFALDEDEGGREVTSTHEAYSGGAVAIRSLGAHWGAGAEVSASSSTFENTRVRVRAAPAFEYSVWPYTESTRRQLTFQYSIGVSAFRYREETIFDRLSETRPTHALVVGYDVRQPWGSADATLEASNYLDDPSQNRLVFDGELEIRIVRGLELEIGGSAALVHDQLSLVKRGATPEEILLRRRALQTDYRYDVRVGFQYTFGSIFNSVVNPRFGTGPGRILR